MLGETSEALELIPAEGACALFLGAGDDSFGTKTKTTSCGEYKFKLRRGRG